MLDIVDARCNRDIVDARCKRDIVNARYNRDIVDAQYNHDVHQSILIALIPSHSHHFFTNWHYQSLCHFN